MSALRGVRRPGRAGEDQHLAGVRRGGRGDECEHASSAAAVRSALTQGLAISDTSISIPPPNRWVPDQPASRREATSGSTCPSTNSCMTIVYAVRNRLFTGGAHMADRQRISYFPLEQMTAEMRAEMERCAREGTPRPESSAIRAHVPAAFWFFANSWNDLFRNGVLDHSLKELCRVYISRSVKCEYCGNQRSEKGRTRGPDRGPVRRAAQLRELRPLRRPPEGGARLRRGDRVADGHRRRVLGPPARALQRARAGRARAA